jgi:hypothetical protein
MSRIVSIPCLILPADRQDVEIGEADGGKEVDDSYFCLQNVSKTAGDSWGL